MYKIFLLIDFEYCTCNYLQKSFENMSKPILLEKTLIYSVDNTVDGRIFLYPFTVQIFGIKQIFYFYFLIICINFIKIGDCFLSIIVETYCWSCLLPTHTTMPAYFLHLAKLHFPLIIVIVVNLIDL